MPRSLRAGADLSPTRRLHRNTYVPTSTAVPRRPRGTPHGRAASSVPHRPRCTGKPLEAHTPVHVIFGWERVDADTDTENDRHAYLPQGRPRTQDPHRSQTNRASSTRLSTHQCGCHGQRPEDNRDAEVGGALPPRERVCPACHRHHPWLSTPGAILRQAPSAAAATRRARCLSSAHSRWDRPVGDAAPRAAAGPARASPRTRRAPRVSARARPTGQTAGRPHERRSGRCT